MFIDYAPLVTGTGYVSPVVMLEFGAHSTGQPSESRVMRTFERVEGMSDSALEQGPGQDWGFVSYPEYLDAVDRYGTGIIRDRGASRLPPRAAGRDGYIAKPIRCKAMLAEVARLTGSATP